MKALLSSLFLLATASLSHGTIADESHPGAASYQRCAACHLASGAGIPGAFPPLQGRTAAFSALPEGREYLVNVIAHGLMGPINVGGTPYMGVMPAQGSNYSAEEMAQLLNYVVEVLDAEHSAKDWSPYSAAEIDSILAASTIVNAQQTHALRETLVMQHENLK